MSIKKRLIWLVVCCFCLSFLAGCGLLGRNKSDVSQGVAYPPQAESPPTSEASLPRPIALSATEAAVTITPTSTTVPPTASVPTAVPPATQPPSTPTGPQVILFTADTSDNNSGKTITFSWQSSGGEAARIYNWANGSLRFPVYWEVPLNGSLTVDIPETRRANPRFELYVYDDETLAAYETAVVEIPWPCSLTYFFDSSPAICPQEEAIYTTAVEQHFEGGRMIWLAEQDWIYVLFDEVIPDGGQGGDLQWEWYDDKWDEMMAEIDLSLSPPDGFYAPVDGFGLVWRENKTVQERLGWALAPETTFDGAWQFQPSDTDNPGGGAVFMQLNDGQVVRLSGFDVWGWFWVAFDPVS